MKTHFKRSFVRDLKRVRDKRVKERIKEAIELVEQSRHLGEIANIKKLRGTDRYYRIRLGDYRIGLVLARESGDVASWRRINRGFLNLLRKRFLVWRTLAPELKGEYRQSGARRLGLVEEAA